MEKNQIQQIINQIIEPTKDEDFVMVVERKEEEPTVKQTKPTFRISSGSDEPRVMPKPLSNKGGKSGIRGSHIHSLKKRSNYED